MSRRRPDSRPRVLIGEAGQYQGAFASQWGRLGLLAENELAHENP